MVIDSLCGYGIGSQNPKPSNRLKHDIGNYIGHYSLLIPKDFGLNLGVWHPK